MIKGYECAGTVPGEGCEAFERYALNEIHYLDSVWDASEDDRFALIDDPEALRTRLHDDFMAAGFCVLAVEMARSKQVAGESPVDIRFAGCQPALDYHVEAAVS